MKRKNLTELRLDLGIALDRIDAAYAQYITAIKVAAKISKEMQELTEDFLSKPHIEIEDFEIDN